MTVSEPNTEIMGRLRTCRAEVLDMRRCSAKTAARMLRDLLAKDSTLPPAVAANVLTAADLLDALSQHEPEPVQQSARAPRAATKQKRTRNGGGARKPALGTGCSPRCAQVPLALLSGSLLSRSSCFDPDACQHSAWSTRAIQLHGNSRPHRVANWHRFRRDCLQHMVHHRA